MFGGGFGLQEMLVVLLLVLLLFGARKIPEVMRGLGQGIREFKEASSKAMSDIDQATSVDSKPAASPPSATTPEEAPKVEPH